MKWTAIAFTGFWLFWSASPAVALNPSTRHTTGPQTIRGTAGNINAHGFTLLSPSKGLYSVSVTKNTQYVEAGAVGRVTVRSGDHVGVRGFVHGHAMTAMSVRVYPSRAAPATHSVRGTVVAIHGSTMDVRAGTNVLHVQLPSSTAVRIGSKKGSAKDLRPGDRIEVRLIGSGCCPTAEHVHI
jgi:carotenoid cleavage dioxygenase-like enzyme